MAAVGRGDVELGLRESVLSWAAGMKAHFSFLATGLFSVSELPGGPSNPRPNNKQYDSDVFCLEESLIYSCISDASRQNASLLLSVMCFVEKSH